MKERIKLIITPIKDIDGRGEGEEEPLDIVGKITAKSILNKLMWYMPKMTWYLFPEEDEIQDWLDGERKAHNLGYYNNGDMPEFLGVTDLYNANQELAIQYELIYIREEE